MVVSANGINIPHACTSTSTHTKSLPAATSESLSPNNVSWSSLVISDFNHILSLIANHLSLIMPKIDDWYVMPPPWCGWCIICL